MMRVKVNYNRRRKILFFILMVLAIIIGNIVPLFLFTSNIVVLQIIFSSIFVGLTGYGILSFVFKKHEKIREKVEASLHARDVLLDLSTTLIKTPDTSEILRTILEMAVDLIESADKGCFMILNKENKLEYKVSIGYEEEQLKKIKFNYEDSFLYKKGNGVIEQPCIIEGVQSFNREFLDEKTYEALEKAKGLSIKSTLSSPIFVDGKLYGMLNMDSTKEKAFHNGDVKTIEFFSKQTGIALRTHQLIDKILLLSRYDDLTNTYNRRHFEELFDSCCQEATRSNKNFSLVYFDLDNLKKVNDNYGHIFGDEIILAFSQGIKDNIRDSDLFARYGGDEFITVFFNTEKKMVEKTVERIKDQLKKTPILINGTSILAEFSFGIASFPEDAKELNELIQIADERMYADKYKLKDAN